MTLSFIEERENKLKKEIEDYRLRADAINRVVDVSEELDVTKTKTIYDLIEYFDLTATIEANAINRVVALINELDGNDIKTIYNFIEYFDLADYHMCIILFMLYANSFNDVL